MKFKKVNVKDMEVGKNYFDVPREDGCKMKLVKIKYKKKRGVWELCFVSKKSIKYYGNKKEFIFHLTNWWGKISD